MSSHQQLPPFEVLTDTKPKDDSMQAFMVSTTRGFLPRGDPIVHLPPEFDSLESILCRMPITKRDGSPGLLAHGTLGETVDKELPDLIPAINRYAGNLPLMNALYRDYSFLASAYLLEPCMCAGPKYFHFSTHDYRPPQLCEDRVVRPGKSPPAPSNCPSHLPGGGDVSLTKSHSAQAC